MKYLLSIMTLVLVSCGDLKPVTEQPAKLLEFSKTPQWEISDLSGYTVDEFTLIVFKQGISAEKWKRIFKQTQSLSQLRQTQKELTKRIHNGEDLEAERDEVTLQITDILSDISENHSAYMLNWGTNEKCSFLFTNSLTLNCKKLPKDAPEFLGTWIKTIPDPKKDLWVFPWLESEIKSHTHEWSMKLKLKPQPKTSPNEWVWSGETVSHGQFSSAHDPFGYVELRLSHP